MNSSRPRDPGRPLDENIDNAILQSAIGLLAEVGFQALTMAEVARRAESTTPAIYRRFANKSELVRAALASEMGALPVTVTDQGSLRDDLIAWVASISHSLTPQRTRILSGLLVASDQASGFIIDIRDRLDQVSRVGWDAIIRRALARGEIREGSSVPDLGRIPGGLIVGRALFLEAPMDAAAIEDLVDGVLLPALASIRTNLTTGKETRR